MAPITNITATNLVTEAYKRSGITSPTSDQITRAKDYFLQEILNDIWQSSFRDGNTRLKSLQTTLLDASVEGQRTLDLAEAFDEELIVEVLDGARYSTATAGGAATLTLASADTGTAATTEGKWIFLTGGTSADDIRQVIDYNATTKVATVDSNWTTTTDNTTTYLIVDNVYRIPEYHISEIEAGTTNVLGRPTMFAKYGRQLIFDRGFNRSTYCIRIRYYSNIHEMDQTEGAAYLYTRVLQNWQSVLTAGVMWKILEDNDDNRQVAKMQEYEGKKTALLAREIPFGGEFTGFTLNPEGHY